MPNFLDEKSLFRFLKKIRKEVCWVWTAGHVGYGYGSFRFQGGTKIAHRIAYQQWIGEIPEGFEIDHKCRNRLCVNPAHLELVTHSENMNRSFAATKTLCIRGHRLFGGNLIIVKNNGKRQCRECKRMRSRLRYAKSKIS